mgnify:FL=1
MTEGQRLVVSLILVLTLLGLVSWVIRITGPRLTAALLGPKQWRDLAAWEERIETLLQEHTRACLHTAAVESELASMVKDMPAGFIHPVQRGIRFGYAYDVALRRKAVELGLFDDSLFRAAQEAPEGTKEYDETTSKRA